MGTLQLQQSKPQCIQPVPAVAVWCILLEVIHHKTCMCLWSAVKSQVGTKSRQVPTSSTPAWFMRWQLHQRCTMLQKSSESGIAALSHQAWFALLSFLREACFTVFSQGNTRCAHCFAQLALA